MRTKGYREPVDTLKSLPKGLHRCKIAEDNIADLSGNQVLQFSYDIITYNSK